MYGLMTELNANSLNLLILIDYLVVIIMNLDQIVLSGFVMRAVIIQSNII